MNTNDVDMELEWTAAHMAIRVGAMAMALWSVLAMALWLTVAGVTASAEELPTPAATSTPPAASTPAPPTVTPSPVSAAYPPCESEDSDGPCRWDASKSGNGKGRSFTVEADGTVKYDDGETVAPENGGGGPAADDWRPSYPGESRTHIGYVDAGPAHVWEGPTDGTGEAGIDSRWHDQWGYPKREVLPDCSRVGSNESCAAPGYRILVSADCSRMIVDDDGHQWTQRKATTCEAGVTPITHQWPDDDATSTPAAPLGKSHKAKSSSSKAKSSKRHSDDAGLFGARGGQSTSSTAADDSAVPDETAAADDAPTEAPATAAPSSSGGSLAHTGIDAATVFGIVVALIGGGVVILAHFHGPRKD